MTLRLTVGTLIASAIMISYAAIPIRSVSDGAIRFFGMLLVLVVTVLWTSRWMDKQLGFHGPCTGYHPRGPRWFWRLLRVEIKECDRLSGMLNRITRGRGR